MRWRVTLTLVFTLLLVVMGLGAVLYGFAVNESRDDFENLMRTTASEYARLALQSDPVGLRESSPSPLHERLGGHTLLLFNAQGQVVDSLSEGTVQAAEKKIIFSDLPTQNQAMFGLPDGRGGVMLPIFAATNNFELAYRLVLLAHDVEGTKRLRQLRNTILAWLSAATLLAVLVGNRLATWLTRPLEQIAFTANLVENGNLSARIKNTFGKDEIAKLKQNINKMLERLEHLVGAQQRFTADAAHDLRTPLSALKTEIEVSLRKPRDAEQYKETLGRLLQQVRGLAALAEDLLTLSRLESGIERREWFLLQDAMEPVLLTRSSEATRLGLKFEKNLPAQTQCYGDAALVVRAIGNLLDNAIHNTKTKISLKAQTRGQCLQIRITDDGLGIPEDLKQHLFERFSHDKNSRGAGLGLAIVDEVARAHGGKVEFEPNLNGVGTVFILELPNPTFV